MPALSTLTRRVFMNRLILMPHRVWSGVRRFRSVLPQLLTFNTRINTKINDEIRYLIRILDIPLLIRRLGVIRIVGVRRTIQRHQHRRLHVRSHDHGYDRCHGPGKNHNPVRSHNPDHDRNRALESSHGPQKNIGLRRNHGPGEGHGRDHIYSESRHHHTRLTPKKNRSPKIAPHVPPANATDYRLACASTLPDLRLGLSQSQVACGIQISQLHIRTRAAGIRLSRSSPVHRLLILITEDPRPNITKPQLRHSQATIPTVPRARTTQPPRCARRDIPQPLD